VSGPLGLSLSGFHPAGSGSPPPTNSAGVSPVIADSLGSATIQSSEAILAREGKTESRPTPDNSIAAERLRGPGGEVLPWTNDPYTLPTAPPKAPDALRRMPPCLILWTASLGSVGARRRGGARRATVRLQVVERRRRPASNGDGPEAQVGRASVG
jgi:hypothetical protein